MCRVLIAIIAVALPLLAVSVPAQSRGAVYGPVISAYLTGLTEEANELEYQLRHQEISRADYDLAKQRLTLQRRYVERHAAQRREDRVPELQILTADELSALKLNDDAPPDQWRVGAEIGAQWRLIGIERLRARFFVLERASATAGLVPERKLGKEIDPRQVIETIIVREARPDIATVPTTPAKTGAALPASAPPSAIVNKAAPKSRFAPPQVLHVYLPEYTPKARAEGVEGELIVRALLQRDGKIKNVKVERGLGYGLDERAVTAVKRLGFVPAQRDGMPVDAPVRIVFNFQLVKVTVFVSATEASLLEKGDRP
jgi:TonB family protein